MARQLERDHQKVSLLALFDSYNFNGTRPHSSVGEKISHVAEKIKFHRGNMAQLGGKKGAAYFVSRFRYTKDRELGRLSVRVSNLANRIHRGNWGQRPKVVMEDFQMQPTLAYKPRAYSGKATVFRFRRNYSSLDDPQMGLGDFVTGGLEIIQLSVNPGGKFVEPHVRELAARLRPLIDEGGR